jgi:hypothetical protein
MPWLDGLLEEELNPLYALWIGLITVTPIGSGAYMLYDTPYRHESCAFIAIVAGWGVYFLVTLVWWVVVRVGKRSS